MKATQKTAQEDSERSLWMLEKVNVIPWEFDITTLRFTYVGPQAQDLLGYPLSDWYKDDFWYNHIHPDDRSNALKSCQEATARGEDHVLEYRMLAANGQIVWLRDIVSLFPGKEAPEKLRGFMFDITEQKLAEKILERKHQLQEVLNALLRLSIEPYDLTHLLDKVLEQITSISWLAWRSKGIIFLSDNNTRELFIKSYRKISPKNIKGCKRIAFESCLCGKAASTKKIQFSSCLNKRHKKQHTGSSPHGHYCVPILLSTEVLGVLVIYLKQGYKRNKDDEEFLLAIANILAGIIRRKQEEEELIEHRRHLELMVKNRTLELTKTNQQLREEISERKQAERSLLREKCFSESIINSLPGIFYIFDEDGSILRWNKNVEKFSEYSAEEISGLKPVDFITNEYKDIIIQKIQQVFVEGEAAQEAKFLSKSGKEYFYYFTGIRMKVGRKKYVVGVGIDISERKKAEQAAQKSEAELKLKTEGLEETNIALKVLLKKREEDKSELENKILSNIKQMVLPYLEKFKTSDTDNNVCLDIIKSNLNNITSSFSNKLSSEYYNFTPTEIQIANNIKHRKSTKEVAEIMCVSETTVQFHRRNIRRKLRIRNKKTNLATHLLNLSE